VIDERRIIGYATVNLDGPKYPEQSRRFRSPSYSQEYAIATRSIMTSTKASIYLGKQAAAQRQLDAAIRMLLANEDDLAIHTVAAAAYGILRELKEAKQHRRKELNDRLAGGIFAFASDLASGKIDGLPKGIAESKVLSDIIANISAQIRAGKVQNEKDVARLLSIVDEKKYWKNFNRAAEFLKHADKGADAFLPMDAIDTDMLLISATSAYVEIMGRPTSEMIVYFVFRGIDIDAFSPKLRAIAAQPTEKRRRACLALLRELKIRGNPALV
jgi:hypothetical protein